MPPLGADEELLGRDSGGEERLDPRVARANELIATACVRTWGRRPLESEQDALRSFLLEQGFGEGSSAEAASRDLALMTELMQTLFASIEFRFLE